MITISNSVSSGDNYEVQPKSMPRLHLKRVVTAGVCLLLLTLIIVFVEHHRRTRPYYRGVPDVDPELWKLLGAQETSTQQATPRPVPQVHVKQLAPLFLHKSWSINKVEDIFFRYLENKDVRCDKDLRLGNWNEGGWNVCLSPPFALQEPCVVFSFGIGNDWQFDESVSNNYKCRVFAFDPSMSDPAVPNNTLIVFRNTGLGASNGLNKKGWKMKTLKQHLHDEGFGRVPIDYVKIDVEYDEWSILKQALTDGSLKLVKQLVFEIHTPELFRIFKKDNKTIPHNPSAERLDFVHMFETLHQVEILGFKKFNYRKNPFGNYHSVYTDQERSCCYELHYINTDFLLGNNTVEHFKDSGLFHR